MNIFVVDIKIQVIYLSYWKYIYMYSIIMAVLFVFISTSPNFRREFMFLYECVNVVCLRMYVFGFVYSRYIKMVLVKPIWSMFDSNI